jgi:hypothetical protein
MFTDVKHELKYKYFLHILVYNDAVLVQVSESAAGLYYRAGDEPEPIDLTHLNIEAAMMCLASKVRYLSGKADSPTLSSRTFR